MRRFWQDKESKYVLRLLCPFVHDPFILKLTFDFQSVAIIGSANTAFDIIQDCYKAGLRTTMVARSPTYIFPYDYVMDSHGIGAYDLLPLEAADRLLNTFPAGLDGQFSHGLFAHLASQEP